MRHTSEQGSTENCPTISKSREVKWERKGGQRSGGTEKIFR